MRCCRRHSFFFYERRLVSPSVPTTMCTRMQCTQAQMQQWPLSIPFEDKGADGGARPSGILRLAISEGPIFLFYLNQVYEDIFAPQTDAFMQPVGDTLVEGLL